MGEQATPGRIVEWNSPIFGALSGVVQKVLEDRSIIAFHPLTGEPTSIPIDWIIRIRDGKPEG